MPKLKKNFLNCFIITIGILGILIIAYGVYLFIDINSHKIATPEQSNLGQFLSGTAGIFITLGTSCFFIATLLLTISELRIQQENFRSENKRYLEDKKLSRLESFETKFFNRLAFLENVVQECYIEILDRTNGKEFNCEGRDVFFVFNDIFRMNVSNNLPKDDFAFHSLHHNDSRYLNFVDYYRKDNTGRINFDFFLNNFYMISLLIHSNSELTRNQKEEYYDYLFSQLDPEQLYFMAFVLHQNEIHSELQSLFQNYINVLKKWLPSENLYYSATTETISKQFRIKL